MAGIKGSAFFELTKMEWLHEYNQQFETERERAKHEDEIIQKLINYLDNGEDIDCFFRQWNFVDLSDFTGTILHFSIINRYGRLVGYALSRGANVAVEIISKSPKCKYRSALDLSIFSSYQIFKMLKKQSVELYSTSFGLTAFHLDCAFDSESNPEMEKPNAAQVNLAVSTASPIWPGMTPIMIAAKFKNNHMLKRLLDLGADPMAKDPEGNTALHYLDGRESRDFVDERFFALDPRNTFSSSTGRSHFHLACLFYPESEEFLTYYLNHGISANLPTHSLGCESDLPSRQVGLHIAAETSRWGLVQLLLEHGAEIDKQDSNGDSPFEYFFKIRNSKDATIEMEFIECISLFIEGGASIEKIAESTLFHYVLYGNTYDHITRRQLFLACTTRLIRLNEDLVAKKLIEVHREIVQKSPDMDVAKYAGFCTKELTTLPSLDLRRILDGSIIVKRNFKRKFGWLDSSDFEAYPIYGRVLKTRAKRKLFEFEEMRRRISRAIPQVQKLLQRLCYLPDLCVENILWNLSCKELEQLLL